MKKFQYSELSKTNPNNRLTMTTYIKRNNSLLKTFAFLLLLPMSIQAQEHKLWQEKQAYNWAFGKNAGINFENGSPEPLVTSVSTLEGSAAISAANGELICYAAANTIYNSNGDIMLNGGGIEGYGVSSTQAGVLVPKPGNPDIYYSFAVPAMYDPADYFTYSEIDMSLDGGNGAVTANKNIMLYENATAEKITAVYHENGTDIWVIIHAMGTNEFLAYLVTEEGVTTAPVVSAVGIVYGELMGIDYACGQIKASPDGSKIAASIPGVFLGIDRGVEVYDFDNATGIISNPIFLEAEGCMYTIEFSPNSQYLYAVDSVFAFLLFTDPVIKQYNITAGDAAAVEASLQIVADLTGSLFTVSNIQLAPDGRIYIANMVGTSSLNVIKTPNNQGAFAGFQTNYVFLGDGAHAIGLPTFNQTYFESGLLSEGNCTNQPVTFSTIRIPDITSITWNFGDPDSGESNISSEPSHFFSAPGTYTVTAEITSNNGTQTATIEVEIIPGPEAVIPVEALRTLCAGPDGNAEFDLTSLEVAILNGQSPGEYNVAFYASEDDYNASIAVASPTSFVTTGQTIFVTVSGGENDCITTISFDLIVNPLPVVLMVEDAEVCGNINGVATVNLKAFDAQLLTGQNLELFEVEYYSDVDGAILIGQPEGYSTATGTVYAKVINKATACASWMPINLSVSPVGDLTLSAITGCSPFDLTQISQQLPGSYTLTYYQSEEDAITGNTITTPDAYMAEGNAGSVFIVAQDTDGCYLAGELSLEAEGCIIPRGISPNSDGINDSFDLSAFNVDNIWIFNRYGMEVFSLNNYTNQWQGQDSNGNELPTGTYFYSLHLVGGEKLTGWVYISREN